MTRATGINRQWVSLPQGSCDARIGPGATGAIGQVLRTTTSIRPRCLLLAQEGSGEDGIEAVRRELVHAGHDVTVRRVPAASEEIADAAPLLQAMAEAGITADDTVLAMGATRALSLASLAAGLWCGGVPLTLMPLDEAALVDATVTPRWLSFAGHAEMVAVRPCARHVIADLDAMETGAGAETSLLARALMAASATAESERAFSRLWDHAPDLMSGDPGTLAMLLADCLKSRGHLVSSTSIAIRQSVSYGRDFARAMALVDPGAPESTLLAEGMRLAARLSCGMGKLSLDDVYAQDDLLAELGLAEYEGTVDPEALLGALREERFLRSSRFLFALPLALGRVRLTAVDDGLLREHLAAWCESHLPGAV